MEPPVAPGPMKVGKMLKIKVLSAVAVVIGFSSVAHAETDFPTFIAGVKAEAEAKGLSPTALAVLDQVQPVEKVIELDHRQPEFTATFKGYLKAIMNPKRIKAGRSLIKQNKTMLDGVGQKYHVPPRFIVALWGIESGFGQSMGNYSVPASLATLAWEGRRAGFFRNELFSALAIIDRGDIPAKQMVGSWAGAMGQCQFMPSTYVKYAQDWDGDGKRDIWHNKGDVAASTANYLAQLGWRDDRGWGRPVKLPKNFDHKLLGLDTQKPMNAWAKLGVVAADGKKLPIRDWNTSIVLADGKSGPAFLVTDNFRALMTWNRSTLFALSVGHLADALGHR